MSSQFKFNDPAIGRNHILTQYIFVRSISSNISTFYVISLYPQHKIGKMPESEILQAAFQLCPTQTWATWTLSGLLPGSYLDITWPYLDLIWNIGWGWGWHCLSVYRFKCIYCGVWCLVFDTSNLLVQLEELSWEEIVTRRDFSD